MVVPATSEGTDIARFEGRDVERSLASLQRSAGGTFAEESFEVPQVGEAEDGTSAIEKAGKQHFDIVFLDLQMPGMSGQEVLNAMPKNPNLHILVVTANPHMTTGPIEEVADYIMYKPINVGEFSAFVKRLKTPQPPLKQ